MKIPNEESSKERFLKLIIDACSASMDERRTMYEKRRRYYLYGQDMDVKTRFNRLKTHMKLVASFLFSSEGLIYNLTPPKNADENTIQQFLALQDDWNEDIHDSGIADVFAEAVLWGLNYDTMILKQGWNDTSGQQFAHLIEPSSFGVYREDNPDFTSQQAMCHTFLLDYDDACSRLSKAGKANMIDHLTIEGASEESGLPPALTQLIITATGGTNLQGNITGNSNPRYESGPNFRANLLAPLVRFHETWVWDDDAGDYRIFTSLHGGESPIILSDSRETIDILKKLGKGTKFDSETNWFLKQENPFTPVTPFSLYNYFWGDSHIEDIIPLQTWSTERLTQIDELLEQQVDPAKSFSGYQGLADETMSTFGEAGTYVADAMPGAKVEEHRPPLPEDLFREFNEIGGLMMEMSGLTEVVSGRGSGGARGGQQQKQMQITGGGQIRKVAVALESPLVRMGDIGIKLKMKNDDGHIKLPGGEEFVAAQISPDFSLRVAGHSHSPLFTQETRELTAMLFKAQAIDQEWVIRLTNPPEKQNLLHSLRMRKAAAEKEKQMHPPDPKAKKK